MTRHPFIHVAAAILLAAVIPARAATVRLDQLDLTAMSSGWGEPRRNLSITQKPLGIGGMKFEHGVGTHAESDVIVQLDGKASLFTANVGVDDNAGSAAASVEFIVLGDGRELWRSGACKPGQKPGSCRVQLDGVKSLELIVTAAGAGINNDHADWADAAFEFNGAPPKTMKAAALVEEAVLLTPPAPAAPRLNCPNVYGARPGSPFLYRIPATGEAPVTFAAEGLPPGLALDAATGIITGQAAQAGAWRATLTAKNSHGQDKHEMRIVVGDTLALTPPMGWNSWYIHYDRVSDAVMRQSADQMIATGMANYGYQYVNIDDCWMKKRGEQPYRGADEAVLPNAKFPDMKGLADYIHGKGLKAGLYTSPGPWTCDGYVGAWQHEAADAREFAGWGFDFLKYDWCSYRRVADTNAPDGYQRPYRLMWGELQKLQRDIVFNLCQYGMDDVWKWGGQMGNCWRTTGDLGAEPNSRLPGFYSIAFSNARHWQFAKPGAWNDPDYILIGWVGDAHTGGMGKPTTLTPNEQYSYMSLWSLMASPLIFSGDMAKLDPFTLNVLCNSEVIAVDQDPLGRQGRIIRDTTTEYVLLRDMEDGSKAVGLFNLDFMPRKMAVSRADLGLAGPREIRDLWRQKDIGSFTDVFEAEVPRHGVAFVRVSGK